MQIVIDARMIKPGSMHGIARYVFQLLHQIKNLRSDYTFTALVNPGSPLEEESWPSHIRLFKMKAKWISFREQWEIPSVLREVKADLFHAPSFVAPLICPCKLVMTIHDLNHMVLPQFYTPLHQFYYQIFVRSCAIRSEYILTVSDFSKKELVRNFALDPGKIFVTYNGVSENYVRVEDSKYLAYVRELYELPENYIFCISNDKPHKNIKQLVRAYCFSDLQIPLVLASPVDRELIRMAELYGKKHLVFFSKYIRERHLPAVYSMARLFVYPSTYEGFGLPPLEALACGIPAVVARSSSLPEVVGGNAIFADPYDFQDIAKALKIGVEDDNIREELCSKGVQHAKKYSWLAMAKKTLDVYEQCLSASKSLTVGEVL